MVREQLLGAASGRLDGLLSAGLEAGPVPPRLTPHDHSAPLLLEPRTNSLPTARRATFGALSGPCPTPLKPDLWSVRRPLAAPYGRRGVDPDRGGSTRCIYGAASLPPRPPR